MTSQPTYQQQFDKITTAYLQDKLFPMSSCACFIGNLLNNTSHWSYMREFTNDIGRSRKGYVKNDPYPFPHDTLALATKSIKANSGNLYTIQEIVDMEANFLFVLTEGKGVSAYLKGTFNYVFDEELLFEAMVNTLEMLRQIHISKGEDVNFIYLQKRELKYNKYENV